MSTLNLSASLTLVALLQSGSAMASAVAPNTPSSSHARMDERQVRDIAWRNGLMIVEEIAKMGPIWALAGRDRDGQELTLDIDGSDGSVLR